MSTFKMNVDGNTAAAYVAYAFSDVSAIYPITPSSPMAEMIDEWASHKRKNIFGEVVQVQEMQSEAGAAGTLHGVLQSGALASTFTASQGLLLMIPNMYKIAGELLPAVFHVAARSIAANNLSIFGDHQDVMATRQTGFAILASSNVQQCMNLAAVSHLSAIKSRIPFLHFFDGFRTSHEVQKIDAIDYDTLSELVDKKAIQAFRDNALTPNAPVMRGVTSNEDITFQMREAVNPFYDSLPDIVQNYMDKVNEITGQDQKLYNYYGDPEATDVIVSMGSSCDTIRGVVESLNNKGYKLGMVEVHLYRPFATDYFLSAFPKTTKNIAVLDRTKEPGSLGEPLYTDVCSAFKDWEGDLRIIGGRYGLASKEFTPDNVISVFENLASNNPINSFTVGINDDVTKLSLEEKAYGIDTSPEGTVACKFWGYGSDGTVGANKSAIEIIGENTDLYTQAYFSYDAKKSGGTTVSHLRFGKKPIREPYGITQADYIGIHKEAYVDKYDVLDGLKEGGIVLLNSIHSADAIREHLPLSFKKKLIDKNADFYVIDADQLARDIGIPGRINMITQAAFFKLANVINPDKAMELLKSDIEKTYGKKGQEIVEKNRMAVDAGANNLQRVDYDSSWIEDEDKPIELLENCSSFVKEVIEPMNYRKGDDLPVSAFKGYEDGTFEQGTAKYEKREVANFVSNWDVNKCIQCNQCSFVCPHAAIRPFLLTEEERDQAPNSFDTLKAVGKDDMYYSIVISGQDCTGCNNCIDICPVKALELKEFQKERKEYIEKWNYAISLPEKKVTDREKRTIKGSQFCTPLQEFSGACAGCGETPYAKLVTQLFGDRMMISNSAGCSTVWGGSAQTSYTKNQKGHGPSWGFSLFEDNAEYGFGMYLGVKKMRQSVYDKVEKLLESSEITADLNEALRDWKEGFNLSEGTRERADKLAEELEKNTEIPLAKDLLENKDYFIKRSHWVFGGDGWAYDIGYGGLDHVIASGENINILVFDTEVYSNTGGQSSKATPTAAVAKFAASGKRTRKKDLGRMAMTYGYVYVAQVAMGANRNHTLKALLEAEAYDGPSIIICYSPCINHGIKGGLTRTQSHEKLAVESGYWQLYRYNPDKANKGENPFSLDSKEPTKSFREFLMTENRYSSLFNTFPEEAEELVAVAEEDAKHRYQTYKEMADAQ